MSNSTKEAVPVQCIETEKATAEDRAMTERKASVDLGRNIEETLCQKRMM